MTGYRELEKRISKKTQEIELLEKEISSARAHLEGLSEALKVVQKSPNEENSEKSISFRHGSDVAKAKELLEKSSKPLHISEILKGIGKEVTRNNRTSLASQIGRYSREGVIFFRVGGNVFGLKGQHPEKEQIPPSDFGSF